MIDLLQKAARAAGEITLKYFRKDFEIKEKADNLGFVTQADLQSQQKIKEIITDGLKDEDIGFIGEESLTSNPKAKHLFIIDPLDGTSNFAKGSESFCISIAYFKDGKAESGVIFEPTKNILHFAQKGEGAFRILNEEKTKLQINPSSLKLAYNLSSDPEKTKQIESFLETLKSKVASMEKTPSAILTILSVVNNQFDLSLNGGSFIWDLAAVKLIVEESGGVMVDWEGHKVELDLEKPERFYKIIVGTEKNIGEVINV